MRHSVQGLHTAGRVVLALLRAAAGSVAHSKPLAGVSLVAALGIWFVVQDVENPRAEATVPGQAQQPIPVRAVNVPDGFIVDTQPVHARVRAREAALTELREGDFEATVDLQGVDAGGGERTLPVRVRSLRSDVRVLSAEPASITVSLVEAGSRTAAVMLDTRGSLPPNLDLATAERGPSVDPETVTVRGRKALVDGVDRVVAVVDLAAIRTEGTHVRDVDLVALNRDGNPQTVAIDPPRARVRLEVIEVVGVKQVRLRVQYSGFPAAGYQVRNAVADPEFVTITGSKATVDAIGDYEVLVAPVEITGARSDITQTRPIVAIEDVLMAPRQIVVKVTIGPIDCGPAQSACPRKTYVEAPTLIDRPPGLRVATPVSVQLKVAGPQASLDSFRPADHARITISLAGAVAGTRAYTVVATLLPSAPAGLRLEPIDDMLITLEVVP